MTTLTTAQQHEIHREVYLSERHGDRILVACRCSIGRAHTYEEWRALHTEEMVGPAGIEPTTSTV